MCTLPELRSHADCKRIYANEMKYMLNIVIKNFRIFFFLLIAVLIVGLIHISIEALQSLDVVNQPIQPKKKFLILEIPVIEYPDGNPLAEPTIVGYEQTIIQENNEFVLDPTTLGSRLGQSVGALRLRLVKILLESITVTDLADTRFDGAFYPRNTVENLEIEDGTCVGAYPLVMDVIYHYCFELDKSDSQIILRYSLNQENTMPTP